MKSSEKQKGSGNIERSLLQGEGNRYARGIHIWRIWEGNLEKAAFKHTGSMSGSGRSPGEGKGNPLQYSCLANPMHREAWEAITHEVADSQI